MVKLNTTWGGEIEVLGNDKDEKVKRVHLLPGINEAPPQVFKQVTTQPGMTHDERKWALIT